MVVRLRRAYVFLSPQVGPDIDPVTVTDLDRVFADRTFGEFLILGNDGKYFVEAVPRYPGSDEYRIQWWNPAWPEMRATRELIYLAQVHEAFAG